MADADFTGDPIARDFTVAGNRLRPLPSGRQRLDALVALIDGARESLRLLYYIYCDDRSGRAVRDALGRAAARGVAVRLLIDGFGSDELADDYFAELCAAGGRVCRFLPRFGRRYLLRNHQKLALADDARVIVGGFNVSDAYFGDDGDSWRDLGLAVEGPAAERLVGYFDALMDWAGTARPRMRDLLAALPRWSEPDGPVRWLLGGPSRRLSPWAQTVRADMKGARRMDMIAAYFAPNPKMLRRIERLGRGGGEARVMTAARSDNTTTIAAARHTYHRLLARGVRVFEYQPSKLHTKLFVIDDVVHVGSANFDIRSLYLNLEIMLRVEDAGFARAMRGYAQAEQARAREVTAPLLAAGAGWWDRAKWAAAYFLVAVLDFNVTRRLNFGDTGDIG